ncbi:uncharacterized protein LOC105695744 isoform X2 [Orussus abietinus]|uniref:uncharacterized protein LOC105695744 isoform X2 n=1 Tax=Orussus abietinus TaxID=222816 RepID=UPI000624F8F4|nr:uncharacterized protein LOC105695744 isoform X2 [Orussus abietinus]
MSGAPARGTAPRRQRRHHHRQHHRNHLHHQHRRHRRDQQVQKTPQRDSETQEEAQESRPKVNPIFLWASQREQRIVEVRCEDYDKRNRIKLTKTPQGWRSIPRTASNVYAATAGQGILRQNPGEKAPGQARSLSSEKENGDGGLTPPTTTPASTAAPARTVQPTQTGDGFGDANPKAHDGSCSGKGNKRKRKRRYASSLEGYLGSANGSDEGDEEDADDGERSSGPDESQNSAGRRYANEKRKRREREFEELRKDQLLQPRVVLEQLHLSQVPRSAHRKLMRPSDEEEEDKGDSFGFEKRSRVNKVDLRDILNLLEATASPVLATDTPSADLPSPMDSTTTCNDFETAHLVRSVDNTRVLENTVSRSDEKGTSMKEKSSREQEAAKNKSIAENGASQDVASEEKAKTPQRPHRTQERSPMPTLVPIYASSLSHAGVVPNYRDPHSKTGVKMGTFGSGHEELARKGRDEPEKLRQLPLNRRAPRVLPERRGSGENKMETSSKTNINSNLFKGADGRSLVAENYLVKSKNCTIPSNLMLDLEEARKELRRIGKEKSSDSILKALRNTPGLSISITTKIPAPENSKGLLSSSWTAKPSSSTGALVEDSDSTRDGARNKARDGTGNAVQDPENRGKDQNHLKNLPGLSITIPSYRYRPAAPSTSPVTNRRVESPESTVNFPKLDNNEHLEAEDSEEADEDEDDEEEDDDEEDDCDSQVLEDLRRQSDPFKMATEEILSKGRFDKDKGRLLSEEVPRRNGASQQIGQESPVSALNGKTNEAVPKAARFQDLEHFDEQVIEDLRSRGTVVSPQPSGIPCSPASRRPSSVYLESLLPSPPCSVSCSEDAKNDLTLKGMLSSPSPFDSKARDHEVALSRVDRIPSPPNAHNREADPLKSQDYKEFNTERNGYKAPPGSLLEGSDRRSLGGSYESRNFNKPSEEDVHSTLFTVDHTLPKAAASKPRNRVNGTADKVQDPATQLRELVKCSGHLIPDPLLVPRDYLPRLAAAPAIEIPKLLASRPELRLPEALTRPELLRDPDLLVISLAHLQHVLDHGEGPVPRKDQSPFEQKGAAKGGPRSVARGVARPQQKPKLSCKPIGTLMPAPIDLSNNRRSAPYLPLLRVRSGLLKQEPEVTSTAGPLDDSHLWHPLFGSQKKQQRHQQYQQEEQPRQQRQQQQVQQPQQQQPQQQQRQQQQLQQRRSPWHKATLAS